jgi:sporulation protein YlmC with PRC-barrel domain
MKTILLCTSMLALFSAPALAQDAGTEQGQTAQQNSRRPVIALSEWAYDELYSSGWSVERMFDETRVVGAGGEQIGDIENVMISADGRILSVIAEIGGFWDIGDTHVSIPWEEVTLTEDLETMVVPVTEETVEDYSVFGDRGFFFAEEADQVHTVNDDLVTGQRVFKATELIGDYAYLTGNERYGYVGDLVFNEEGQLQAVLVDAYAGGAPGLYAYPYYGYGYGWHPAMVRYSLPYSREDVTFIDTFDTERMASNMENAEAPAGIDDATTSAAPADEEAVIEEDTSE